MEAAGRIEEVGPGVPRERIGEAVVVGTQHGAYAERLVVPSALALPAMPGFTLEENAAFPVNYMTAWVALMEMARLRPTDRVLISAAAGGVGTAAVQIAHHYGCDVIAMAGSDDKLERVRTLGAGTGVNYRAPDFARRLEDAVGSRRVDVSLEVVGGDVFRRSLASLAPFGRLVVAGYASMNLRRWNPWSWWRTWRDAPRVDVMTLARASGGILATHIGYLLADAVRLERVWRALTAFVREHGIRPVVGHTFPFQELPDAHRLMESRKSTGKIVVRVD